MTETVTDTSPGSRCGQQSRVDRHFAGNLGVSGERQLRLHLHACGACRARYDRHLRLGRLDPRALRFEDRLRRGLGLARPAAERGLGWMAAAGVLALGMLVLLPRLPGWPSPGGGPDWRARGSGPMAAPLVLALDGRGTEVSAFRTSGPGAPAPVSSAIPRSAELAFAYRNGGGWSRLMVFALDARGAVYWFYPQWLDPAADPVGVELAPGQELHELPAAVSHDFPAGRLTVCALASRQPLSARQVERVVSADPARSAEQALAAEQAPGDESRAIACQPVEVAP